MNKYLISLIFCATCFLFATCHSNSAVLTTQVQDHKLSQNGYVLSERKKYLSSTLEICKNDPNAICKYIVNPFMGYYISDQYIGDDYERSKGYKVGLPEPDGINILKSGFKHVQFLDVIYVQVDYFQFFCEQILPKIDKKFILITGQYHLPQLYPNQLTESILDHPLLHMWYSQNPIYTHPKYAPIPYGIRYTNLSTYVKALNNKDQNQKTSNLIHLHVTMRTNRCRKKLPDVPRLPLEKFYQTVSDARFILSPEGDRPDCYRHWEAIGLGTMPISNISNLYKPLFGENLIFVNDIEEMLDLLADPSKLQYIVPNEDMVCVDYWKDKILLVKNQQ